MLRRVRRGLSRDLVDRSTSVGRRAAHAVTQPALEPLERREVPSAVSAVGPRQADLVTVPTAEVAPPVGGQSAPSPGFVPMFNGIDTAGWFNPYDWGRAVAKNGQILLTGDKNFFLVTKQTYSNFILEADVLIPPGGNSGVQFRSQYGLNFMQGYQADMDTGNRNWAGGLYFQDRGWLDRPAHRAPVVPGHLNHYVVEAIGNHIVITVNGKVTIDTHNYIASNGHIALQDHGSPGVYHFKNVEIEVLP
jgi:hypothetical protein